jgi:hypothetical protein
MQRTGEQRLADARGKFCWARRNGREVNDTDWTPGRVLLSNRRLVLAGSGGKLTVSRSVTASAGRRGVASGISAGYPMRRMDCGCRPGQRRSATCERIQSTFRGWLMNEAARPKEAALSSTRSRACPAASHAARLSLRVASTTTSGASRMRAGVSPAIRLNPPGMRTR